MNTCILCGHTGPDVQVIAVPKGSDDGIPWAPQCQDIVACWKRCEAVEGVVVQRVV